MVNWFRKQLNRIRHPLQSYIFDLLPRTRFDYQREVGQGYGSSVVMAPIKFIQRVFPEAPLKIKRKAGDSEEEILDDHEMVDLIRRPNSFYSGNVLWRATIAAWLLEGNAYWLKVRNRFFTPVELWWVPPWMIRPKYPDDGSVFITHYEYDTPEGPEPIDIRDVVHFRNGLDPRNPRLGVSDLHSILREVFIDDESSNYTSTILRNMGVPGVVISPKSTTASPDDAQATKEWFLQETTGDRRGGPLVMRGPSDVHQFSWSPAQLELGTIRDVSEERVCAVIGIPAAVVGFGTGLQQTKVGATMRELVQLAWIGAIVPMQHTLSEDIDLQLLPDFEGDDSSYRAFFDDTMVAVLQESNKERAERLNIGVQGGWIRRSEARREMRYPVTEEDDVYLGSSEADAASQEDPPLINGGAGQQVPASVV